MSCLCQVKRTLLAYAGTHDPLEDAIRQAVQDFEVEEAGQPVAVPRFIAPARLREGKGSTTGTITELENTHVLNVEAVHQGELRVPVQGVIVPPCTRESPSKLNPHAVAINVCEMKRRKRKKMKTKRDS
nr:uncharacterized protein LOC113826991 [Penaeus vannamei]